MVDGEDFWEGHFEVLSEGLKGEQSGELGGIKMDGACERDLVLSRVCALG